MQTPTRLHAGCRQPAYVGGRKVHGNVGSPDKGCTSVEADAACAAATRSISARRALHTFLTAYSSRPRIRIHITSSAGASCNCHDILRDRGQGNRLGNGMSLR